MTDGGSDQRGSLPGLSGVEAAQLAERHGLARVGVRPPFLDYVGQMWAHRHFLLTLSHAGFVARHQNNYLGVLWSVLNPLLFGAAYWLIFGQLLGTTGKVENYVAFLLAGLFTFIFFSAGFNHAAKSMVQNTGLVRALRFPRAILPFSVVITELIAGLPAFAILLLAALATGETPSLKWLLFPLALLIAGMITLGIGMITARIVHAARDVGNLVGLATRVLRYVSGVFFPIADYAGHGLIGTVMMYQPVAVMMTLVRESLLGEFPPDLTSWLVGAAWGVGLCAVGFVVFWRAEASYGRA